MDWIRAFFGGLLLAMTLVLGAAIWTTPAGAQQIIIQGAFQTGRWGGRTAASKRLNASLVRPARASPTPAS